MYVQIKKGGKVQNMKRFKKLYEYVIDIQLDYQFTKQIVIDEQTKNVLFELVVLHNGNERVLIKDTRDFVYFEVELAIKNCLLDAIQYDIVDLTKELGVEDKSEPIENGFVVNGKEFLLKDNNYADLREKVLKEVKEYALH